MNMQAKLPQPQRTEIELEIPRGVTLRKGSFGVVEGGEYGPGKSRRMKRSEFDQIENGSSMSTFARGRMKSVGFEEEDT
jgi:hypothetical protein